MSHLEQLLENEIEFSKSIRSKILSLYSNDANSALNSDLTDIGSESNSSSFSANNKNLEKYRLALELIVTDVQREINGVDSDDSSEYSDSCDIENDDISYFERIVQGDEMTDRNEFSDSFTESPLKTADSQSNSTPEFSSNSIASGDDLSSGTENLGRESIYFSQKDSKGNATSTSWFPGKYIMRHHRRRRKEQPSPQPVEIVPSPTTAEKNSLATWLFAKADPVSNSSSNSNNFSDRKARNSMNTFFDSLDITGNRKRSESSAKTTDQSNSSNASATSSKESDFDPKWIVEVQEFDSFFE